MGMAAEVVIGWTSYKLGSSMKRVYRTLLCTIFWFCCWHLSNRQCILYLDCSSYLVTQGLYIMCAGRLLYPLVLIVVLYFMVPLIMYVYNCHLKLKVFAGDFLRMLSGSYFRSLPRSTSLASLVPYFNPDMFSWLISVRYTSWHQKHSTWFHISG